MPISNERRSPFARKFPSRRPPAFGGEASRPHVEEDTLKSANIQIERKAYHLTLKENVRGRFLRITETTSARHDSIMIPDSGLEAFVQAFAGMLSSEGARPDSADLQPDSPELQP